MAGKNFNKPTPLASADRALLNSAEAAGAGVVGESVYTSGDVFRANRYIDRRLARGSPHRGQLTRGYILRKNDKNQTVGRLHFLFNPTSVNVNYSIDPELLYADIQGPTTTNLLGTTTGLSFQLIFDRTYEVIEGTLPQGVMHDVLILEHLLNMVSADGTRAASPVGQPLHVFFGGSEAFAFKGRFAGARVDMTHFTPKMVPVRMVMDLSFQRLPEQDSSAVVNQTSVTNSADQVLINGLGGLGYTPPPAPSSSGGSSGGGGSLRLGPDGGAGRPATSTSSSSSPPAAVPQGSVGGGGGPGRGLLL